MTCEIRHLQTFTHHSNANCLIKSIYVTINAENCVRRSHSPWHAANTVSRVRSEVIQFYPLLTTWIEKHFQPHALSHQLNGFRTYAFQARDLPSNQTQFYHSSRSRTRRTIANTKSIDPMPLIKFCSHFHSHLRKRGNTPPIAVVQWIHSVAAHRRPPIPYFQLIVAIS